MCIYCGTTKYRKIYENHYGPIPKDETGRTYEIHHIDGNRKNNNPANLQALSIKDHYDVHYQQGDWGACLRIGSKMKISQEELSAIASKNLTTRNIRDWELLGKAHPVYKHNLKLLKEGKHNLQGPDTNNKRLEEGTHNFIQIWKCSYCGKEGKNLSLYKKWGHEEGTCLKERDFIPKKADTTIYQWENIKTGEKTNMTRTELKRTYNLRSQEIYSVVKGKKKTTKGWKLVK